tara:strand:+ start:473 stop:2563 length:2091 start_codon:yes stop_codon:yes gene_type:complete
MSFSVKTISIIIAANVKGLEKGMGSANKSLARFSSQAARMGSMLTFGVTAPLAALGKAAVDTFVEFEDGMMKVAVVTGATESEMKKLEGTARELGKTTQFTASEFAELQLILGRKGFDPSQIMGMQEAIADLALATGEDLAIAAETVSASINAFNLEATDAASVANTLALAAANSSIQLNTFSTAFGHAGASANAVGVSVENLSAMMGVLMDNGIKASKAGTGLRTIFMELNKEGVPFTGVLEDMASGTLSLNDAQALVGKTAANQLLILSQNLDKVTELTTEYETNTTALGEMADKMESTTQGKIKKMQSAINELQLVFGELLTERLIPVIEKITELANTFSDLDKSTQNTIITLAGIAAALGLVLLAAAALVPLMAALASGFAIIGGAITAVLGVLLLPEVLLTALAVAIMGVVVHYGSLRREADKLADSQKELNKEMDDFRMLNSGSGTALSEISKGMIAAKKAADELFLSQRALNNQAIKLTAKKITSVGDFSTDESQLNGGRVDSSSDKTEFSTLELTKLGVLLNFTGEQIVTLNELGTDMLSNFSEGFVNLFEKQTRFVEVNGVMEEQTISFGEKFGTFAKQFLIDIGKMIAKALIFAGLMQLTGLGGAKTFGGGFMKILGFADGGRPPVGRPSVVGERGPELFVPGSSGTIIPNHALGGGGGSMQGNVTISGDDLLVVFDRAQRRKSRR